MEFKNKINIGKIISPYIQLIFSYLDIKQKLNMIMYNKELKKIMDVGIYDYKRTSGKYKIAEKNGKGREYNLNTNQLIFEGEYVDGKRDGKGKEYYMDGELKFEGEYSKGKRNGKAKIYFFNDIYKFEGEFLEGKIWNGKEYNKAGNIEFEIKNGKGFIKEYNYYGKLGFEGEYLNGKRNGKGKEYWYDGKLRFEGEYLDGKRNGKAKYYYYNGRLFFNGEHINGFKRGKVFYYDGKLLFEGEFLNERMWNGKRYNKTGNIDFEIKEGKGFIKEYNIVDKLIFEGDYLNGI